jgi:hypothetical protein
MKTQQSDQAEKSLVWLETLDETWNYIQAMDMSHFRRKLVQPRWGRPIPEKVVDHAIEDYRRFLFLLRKYAGEALSPTLDIDLLWHEHILDTQPYFEDTARIFGRYIHHEPGRTPGERSPDLQRSFRRTCELYRQEFGEDLQTFFDHLPALEEEQGQVPGR